MEGYDLMNLTLIFSYIFKAGFCYGIVRYGDDMMVQVLGIMIGLGFLLEAVDRLRNDAKMNNKGES